MTAPLTFLDLFCGCGGFSLGLQRAGLKGLAAIDSNREAIQVFRANFKNIGLEAGRGATAVDDPRPPAGSLYKFRAV
jgi:site-specific DNA-cytosine methylase